MGRLFCLVRRGRPGVACRGKEEKEGGRRRRRRRQLRTFLTANEGETPVGFSRIGEGKNAAERRKNPPGKDERARVKGGGPRKTFSPSTLSPLPPAVFFTCFFLLLRSLGLFFPPFFTFSTSHLDRGRGGPKHETGRKRRGRTTGQRKSTKKITKEGAGEGEREREREGRFKCGKSNVVGRTVGELLFLLRSRLRRRSCQPQIPKRKGEEKTPPKGRREGKAFEFLMRSPFLKVGKAKVACPRLFPLFRARKREKKEAFAETFFAEKRRVVCPHPFFGFNN